MRVGEIWTYNAIKPNNNETKIRPVLIIGTDEGNRLNFIDINYVIISSSAQCGKYDIQINNEEAKKIGLARSSVIKTTKIYTGSQSKLGIKIGELPNELKKEFISKYTNYQRNLINNLKLS